MALINYRHTSEYRQLVTDISASLVEEAKTRVASSKEEALRRLLARHEMASEIINHPAYQKFAKGNQPFVENFRKDIKREVGDKIERVIGKSSIYDALQLYEAEPDIDKIIKKLGEEASLTRAMVVYCGRDVSKFSESLETTCRRCFLHCPKTQLKAG